MIASVVACVSHAGSFVILMLAAVIFLVSAFMQRRAAQWYGRSADEGRERLAQLSEIHDRLSDEYRRPE